MNRFLVVLAPYGAGGSAVAGALDKLGAFSCPPHADPYESASLRDMLQRHIHEPALMFQGDYGHLSEDLKQWLTKSIPQGPAGEVTVLYHPLLMLVLPVLISVLRPQIAVVRRSLVEIGALARQGDAMFHHGEAGARILYKQMFAGLAAQDMSYLDIHYPELISDPESHVVRLAAFAGLDPRGSKRAAAIELLRSLEETE